MQQHHKQKIMGHVNLRMIAWEVTRRCNLACVHCRASAADEPLQGELSTGECLSLLNEVASWANPVIILTGGEPLLREDIFEIASHGTKLGLRMVMAPNGTLMDERAVQKMLKSGIGRISISLDGNSSESHDRFRQVEGAFEGALRGIRLAKEAGLEFQINTTVTQHNLHILPDILHLAGQLGAKAHHIFLLVPTGRGKYIADSAINAKEYEKVLNWFYDQRKKVSLHLKATCAPHYHRIIRQRAKEEGETITFETHGLDAVTRGCLGGTSFCFISHRGDVQPCGYLDISCGNVRHDSLKNIWNQSEHFLKLRNLSLYKGKCGLCEFRRFCGGCRARAFEATGDYLAEEPLCTFQPHKSAS
jgi:AdoMet-dependent heme synthase